MKILSVEEQKRIERLFYEKVENEQKIESCKKKIQEIQRELEKYNIVRTSPDDSISEKQQRPEVFSMKVAVQELFDGMDKNQPFATGQVLESLQKKYPDYGITSAEINSALNYQKRMGTIRNIRKGVFEFVVQDYGHAVINVEDIPF